MNPITYAAGHLFRILPRAGITRVAGSLADMAWPAPVGRAVVDLYCRAYGVNLEECEETHGYRSFDAFFTRELRAGARPQPKESDVIVSPADGRVESLGNVDGRTFVVKGRPYRVEDLLGDAGEAERFSGGLGCVIYLSPRDYHRVHAPASGWVRAVRSLPGDYFPVNSLGVQTVPDLFVRNRRVALMLDTPEEVGLGRIALVMVAAMVVGRITVRGVQARDVPYGVHTLDDSVPVSRGDELGVFRLGSTAVLFLEERAALRFSRGEGPVRWGQCLASRDGRDR